MVKTLNVLGCGNVGKTLSRLWAENGVFRIGDVLNRSLSSGSQAVAFVGSGHAIADYCEMQPADVVMISASDESIEACCQELCRNDVLHQGTILFHCSGCLPSTLLHGA